MKNSSINDNKLSRLLMNSSRLRPFVHFSCSASDTLIAFLIFLIPQIFMLAKSGAVSSLYIILFSILGTISAEILNGFLLKEKFYGLSSVILGIIIGLLLPSNYPHLPVFFLTFISMIIFRYSFGGYARPWINSIAITVALAWILDVTCFPQFLVSRDQLFMQNPSLQLIQSGAVQIFPFDNKITAFFNQKIFSIFGVSIPDGYVSFLWDTNSVIPAFRFNIITLITSAVFFAFDFVGIIVPACYIAVYGLLVYFLSPVFSTAISGSGDVILAIFSSGTLFCALFLLPWFGTTPASIWGKIIYASSAGIIAFFITGCGTSPVGSVFTVILSDIVSLFMQQAENFFAKRKMNYLLRKEICVVMEDEK